ncbi:MAG: SDR family oxidoreductase [Actinomycetota bacterium]|nr:SDR family oxidoreductase [Actinomycetota bacterium]
MVDISIPGRVKELCDKIYTKFGRVDVLCNNAGVAVGGRIEDIPLEDWRWIVGSTCGGHPQLALFPSPHDRAGGLRVYRQHRLLRRAGIISQQDSLLLLNSVWLVFRRPCGPRLPSKASG